MRAHQAVSGILSLLCIGMWILVLYLIYVLPVREAVWKDYGAQLPMYVRMLITTGHFLRAFWFLVLPFLSLATLGFAGWFVWAFFARKKS